MKKLFLLVMLISIFQIHSISRSDLILEEIISNDGWEEFKQKGDTVFRRKEVAGFDLFALEIKRTVTTSPEDVFSVLLNVGDYARVLGDNKYLEAEEVFLSEKEIIGYQYAKIPIIPNRHYLFRFDLASYEQSLESETNQLHWVLIEGNGEYKEFIDNKKVINNNPIYIQNGAGLWSVRELSSGKYEHSYRLYLDPSGWMPAWLLNSFNVKNLQELFDRVLEAAEE